MDTHLVTYNVNRIFILDEETEFLAKNISSNKCTVIVSAQHFKGFISAPFQVEEVYILVEMDWNQPISEFRGYEVAKELLNSGNSKSIFSIHFISTLDRETLYGIIKSSNRIFAKSFIHSQITPSFDLMCLVAPNISVRKFEYLRKYCLTESGILDKLEHDIRPGKNLSSVQIGGLIQDIRANADLVGTKVMKVIRETTVSNFQRNRRRLHEQIASRIMDFRGVKEGIEGGADTEDTAWKPQLVLLEDDDSHRERMALLLKPYFNVKSICDGAAAIEYLRSNAEQVSAALCDMELLQKNNLDQEIQGIDVLENIKTNHPHIVVRVVSHLPRRGLEVLLGDMLRVSDLIYKSMLLDGNHDFISDLVTEVKREIDLKQTFQKFRGPSNTLWGNFSRQGGSGGRLKQFYYSLKNDPDKKKEFDQMWKEIDEKIQSVLENNSRIDSHFPQVEKRNEIAEMPLQKSLVYLKELLINRMFWIKKLYIRVQITTVNFEEFKNYFENEFALFSTNEKRFNHYGSLTGFSISKSTSDNVHKLGFNQLLDEELHRVDIMSSNFDYINTYLPDTVYDILDIISKAGMQASYTKGLYPLPQNFWDSSDQLALTKAILLQLTKEKPSASMISKPESREKVFDLLSQLKHENEFDSYSIDIRKLITEAQSNMNPFPEN